MFKKITLAVSVLVFLVASSAPTFALPVIDIGVGARYWSATPSGDLNYKGDNLDLEDNMGFEREWSPSAYVRAQLPFITLDGRFTQLDYSGSVENINQETRFGGLGDLRSYSNPSTEATLNFLHGGAMFSFPVPMVDLGLGAGATLIDAEASVEVPGEKETGSAEAPIPVGKAYFQFSPPILDMNVSLAGEGVAYSGNTFYDARAKLGYVLQGFILGDLQLEGGYRIISVDYDEEDLMLDASFSGPFLGLSLNF